MELLGMAVEVMGFLGSGLGVRVVSGGLRGLESEGRGER